jgi:ABC-type enterobactin transport system permease subunit
MRAARAILAAAALSILLAACGATQRGERLRLILIGIGVAAFFDGLSATC